MDRFYQQIRSVYNSQTNTGTELNNSIAKANKKKKKNNYRVGTKTAF